MEIEMAEDPKLDGIVAGFKEGRIASESLHSAASKMRDPKMDSTVAAKFEGIVAKLHDPAEIKGLDNGGYEVRNMFGAAVGKAMGGEVAPTKDTVGTTLATLPDHLMKHTTLLGTNPALFVEIAGFSASLAAVAPKAALAAAPAPVAAAPSVAARAAPLQMHVGGGLR